MERWLGRVGGIRTGSGRGAKVEDKVGRCAGSGGEAWPAPRACEPGGRVLGWAHSAAGAPGFKPPPARGRAAPWRRRSAWRLPLPAPRRCRAPDPRPPSAQDAALPTPERPAEGASCRKPSGQRVPWSRPPPPPSAF